MNQKQILAKYQEAAKALYKAQEALKQINGDWHNWSSADAGYYADQIAELLSATTVKRAWKR